MLLPCVSSISEGPPAAQVLLKMALLHEKGLAFQQSVLLSHFHQSGWQPQ
jgi:hypothetical protein